MAPQIELIGSAEACELLQVDRATISRWVKSGVLPIAHKVPGLRGANLFRRNDIEKLAAERAEQSA